MMPRVNIETLNFLAHFEVYKTGLKTIFRSEEYINIGISILYIGVRFNAPEISTTNR